jgi:carotenoid cleavage dioxygenase
MLEMLKSKTGIIDTSKGDGTANTSIVYHAGKIMALHEGDLPYQVRVSGLARSGRYTWRPFQGFIA